METLILTWRRMIQFKDINAICIAVLKNTYCLNAMCDTLLYIQYMYVCDPGWNSSSDNSAVCQPLSPDIISPVWPEEQILTIASLSAAQVCCIWAPQKTMAVEQIKACKSVPASFRWGGRGQTPLVPLVIPPRVGRSVQKHTLRPAATLFNTRGEIRTFCIFAFTYCNMETAVRS